MSEPYVAGSLRHQRADRRICDGIYPAKDHRRAVSDLAEHQLVAQSWCTGYSGAGTGRGFTAKVVVKGCIANAINPKVVLFFLFFLSFLPQFVIAENGHVASQIAGLGLTFTLQAALLFSVLGYFSGLLANGSAGDRMLAARLIDWQARSLSDWV